jgi:hypothetical protein
LPVGGAFSVMGAFEVSDQTGALAALVPPAMQT